MEEYPNNTQKRRQESEPKKVERIVTGEVIRKKKPVGRKVKEFLLGVDPKALWLTVWFGVLVPAAKDMVYDAGEEALRQRILGDSGRGGGRRRSRNRSSSFDSGHYSYDRPPIHSRNTPREGRREDPRDRDLSRRARSNFDFDEIILESRVEAEETLDSLFRIIEEFGTASVSDLYGILGVTPAFTDGVYGWMDIRDADASVTRVHDGYLLNLPKPEPIDH